MVVSKRFALAMCTMVTGASLLVAAVMTSTAGASTSPGAAGGCSPTAHIGPRQGGGAGASTPTPGCTTNAPPPTSSDSPPDYPVVQVTEASNQQTVDLLEGRTLAVRLGADFRTPTVSGPALEQLSASGGYPSGRPLRVTYRAAAPGSVDITTSTDYRCRHVRPACARPTISWTVHVNVIAVPPHQVVTVSVADDQRTVTLKVGDVLKVNLPIGYTQPSVTPNGVLSPYVPGLVSSTHMALKPGQADVTSLVHNDCFPAPSPCPTPSFLPWVVHVIVTA